jgi:hypothetical protein
LTAAGIQPSEVATLHKKLEGASNNDVFARDCAPVRFASDLQR